MADGGAVGDRSPAVPRRLTLLAFQFALWLYRRSGWLVLQPVMVSMLLVVGALLACGMDYATYREGAAPIAFLLGPVTIALAVPCITTSSVFACWRGRCC